MPKKKKKTSGARYSTAIKRDAVARLISGSISQRALAQELGVAVSTLHHWRTTGAAGGSASAGSPSPGAAAEVAVGGRRKFSDALKREAVGRLEARSIKAAELAAELKVSPQMLRRWRRSLRGPSAAPRVAARQAAQAGPPVAEPEDLYALVGRLTVENRALRQRLGEA